MTIYYEFGGDDLHPGDDFEYEVDDDAAFREYLDKLLGREIAKTVWNELSEYIDITGFVRDNKDYFADLYEDDAKEMWEA